MPAERASAARGVQRQRVPALAGRSEKACSPVVAVPVVVVVVAVVVVVVVVVVVLDMISAI